MIVGAFTRFGNTLRFRGRLVSLLAPARGMSRLPAKGGFSRPSSFSHCGVSSRPLGLRLLVPPKKFAPAGVSHIMRVYLRFFHTCIWLNLRSWHGYCFPCRHSLSAGG